MAKLSNNELRAWFFLGIATLGVGTFATTQAVQNTDLIAECTTPETRCAKLTAENRRLEQENLKILMKTTNICVLYASREADVIEEVAMIYDNCVEVGSPPPPPPIVIDE